MRQTTKIRMLPAVWAATLLPCCCGCAGLRPHLSGGRACSQVMPEGYSRYAARWASTVIEIRNPWRGATASQTRFFVSAGTTSARRFDGVTVAAPCGEPYLSPQSTVALPRRAGCDRRRPRGIRGRKYISNKDSLNDYREKTYATWDTTPMPITNCWRACGPTSYSSRRRRRENTAVTDKFRELHIPFVYIRRINGDHTPLGKANGSSHANSPTGREGGRRALYGHRDTVRFAADAGDRFAERPSVMLNATATYGSCRATGLHGTAHRGCGRPLPHFSPGRKAPSAAPSAARQLIWPTAGRCLAESQPGQGTSANSGHTESLNSPTSAAWNSGAFTTGRAGRSEAEEATSGSRGAARRPRTAGYHPLPAPPKRPYRTEGHVLPNGSNSPVKGAQEALGARVRAEQNSRSNHTYRTART